MFQFPSLRPKQYYDSSQVPTTYFIRLHAIPTGAPFVKALDFHFPSCRLIEVESSSPSWEIFFIQVKNLEFEFELIVILNFLINKIKLINQKLNFLIKKSEGRSRNVGRNVGQHNSPSVEKQIPNITITFTLRKHLLSTFLPNFSIVGMNRA